MMGTNAPLTKHARAVSANPYRHHAMTTIPARPTHASRMQAANMSPLLALATMAMNVRQMNRAVPAHARAANRSTVQMGSSAPLTNVTQPLAAGMR